MIGSFFVCETCKDSIRDGVCLDYEKEGVHIYPIMQGNKLWGRIEMDGGWRNPAFCLSCTKKELERMKEEKHV